MEGDSKLRLVFKLQVRRLGEMHQDVLVSEQEN